jgi:hypothetical protein
MKGAESGFLKLFWENLRKSIRKKRLMEADDP